MKQLRLREDQKWPATQIKMVWSVANPTKTTKMGMDDMEEVIGVHGDITRNSCPTPAPGEMERGITQDLLEISRVVRPYVFPA
jgi:hypothetical protein